MNPEREDAEYINRISNGNYMHDEHFDDEKWTAELKAAIEKTQADCKAKSNGPPSWLYRKLEHFAVGMVEVSILAVSAAAMAACGLSSLITSSGRFDVDHDGRVQPPSYHDIALLFLYAFGWFFALWLLAQLANFAVPTKPKPKSKNEPKK